MRFAKQENPGLISGFVGVAKSLFALMISRIELACFEFSELSNHLLKLLLLCGLSIIALCFALAFWSGLAVVLLWDALGWKIVLIIAVFFSVLAIGTALYLRNTLLQGKLGFPVTMEELRKDRDALLGSEDIP